MDTDSLEEEVSRVIRRRVEIARLLARVPYDKCASPLIQDTVRLLYQRLEQEQETLPTKLAKAQDQLLHKLLADVATLLGLDEVARVTFQNEVAGHVERRTLDCKDAHAKRTYIAAQEKAIEETRSLLRWIRRAKGEDPDEATGGNEEGRND